MLKGEGPPQKGAPERTGEGESNSNKDRNVVLQSRASVYVFAPSEAHHCCARMSALCEVSIIVEDDKHCCVFVIVMILWH